MDCASPLALWNGAVRTPAKPSTSPLPPSSILNPLSSVFIQASILPQTISQSVTYGSFDTIFFFEGVFDPFRTKNEKRRIHQTPVFIDPNDAFCLIFKICKKTAFFEGSKNSFFTITQTLPKSATTSAARSALECASPLALFPDTSTPAHPHHSPDFIGPFPHLAMFRPKF
ncbi:MAG TPA: hypothetical protein VFC07_16655 [Verrucomicrobiae bacterium]|nr:hypothetical protein [Verrucomicrobiae bacterium]